METVNKKTPAVKCHFTTGVFYLQFPSEVCLSVVPRSQPAVGGPEAELSTYGDDIARGPVTCTAIDYWLGHKDKYPIYTVGIGT